MSYIEQYTVGPRSIKSASTLAVPWIPGPPGGAHNPSKIDAKTKGSKERPKGSKQEPKDTCKVRICDACAVQMTSHRKRNFPRKLKISSKMSPFWLPVGLPFWSLFHKSDPKGPGTDPKVPKRHQNGSQGCPNGAQGCPNGARRSPKSESKASKMSSKLPVPV